MIATIRSARSSGFTLLEVLMVVLVVGILSAVVLISLNPGGPERKLGDETERLASLISLASNEAVMQNREYGVRLEQGGYGFLCLDDKSQKWRECVGDSMLKHHVLPEGLEVRALTGSRMSLPQGEAEEPDTLNENTEKEEVAILTPDVILLSSGEASPVELEIRVIEEPSLRMTVIVDDIGRVKWGEQAEMDDDNAK
ncbi:MAG TPA: type II secretion system protein GspH [Moraxellaceae bacterium]|nr:type II secretion system protein GspH [Moraxellaceae bacterium]